MCKCRRSTAGGLAVLLFAATGIVTACAAQSVGQLPDKGGDDTKDEDLEARKAPAPASASASTPAADASARCSDKIKDGDETDVDCGGGCGACADGRACRAANDCAGKSCVSGTCCSNVKKNVTLTTGPISGTKQLCCPAGGTLVDTKDCGDGDNHGARALDGRCAEAHEGSGNGGSACVQITCAVTACGGDAGPPPAKGS